MSVAALAPADWAQLADLVARHMGLHFPPARWCDLQRGVVAAARELGADDPSAWLRRLLAAPLQPAQLKVLARHLTIGETYFLRDPRLLETVARQVLAPLIEARRGRDQRLRIWSAGCASGEEPYSLAILLTRMLPDLADWRITITATDINTAALQKAVAGVYGEWSFRAAPAWLKATCFEPRGAGRYAIAPRMARLVNFEYLNLAQDVYPSLETDTHAMDLVFCRNVLMYFTPAQVRGVVARLHAALVPGGALVVSPSETSQALFAQFATLNFPGAILYRKNAPAPGPAQARPIAPQVRPAAPSTSEPPPDPRPSPQLARTLADQGRLAEALACCERWIATDKVDPKAHYLRAAVLIELGDSAAARTALRRAIFLDAGFVLAHFALGNLARREGRDEEAVRHFANARALLGRYRDDDLLPEGDGLNAGRLARMLQAMLAAESTP